MPPELQIALFIIAVALFVWLTPIAIYNFGYWLSPKNKVILIQLPDKNWVIRYGPDYKLKDLQGKYFKKAEGNNNNRFAADSFTRAEAKRVCKKQGFIIRNWVSFKYRQNKLGGKND